jgi:hypothetical protein
VSVEVNGHNGKWIFDTGANWLTVSESEAAEMDSRCARQVRTSKGLRAIRIGFAWLSQAICELETRTLETRFFWGLSQKVTINT